MITTKVKSIEEMYVDVTGMEIMPAEILADYRKNGASGVIDVGTLSAEYTKDLMDRTIKYVNSIADGWTHPEVLGVPGGGACTCCMKKLDDGSVVMGRNMDLPISFGPAVIFRTKGNGKDTYDTVNISYSAPAPIPFEQVLEIGGIPRFIFEQMAITACDAFNSEGLYLQYDMRECADCPSKSTNPNGKLRVATFNLIRVIVDHCATIDETLEYLKELDIYDPKYAAFDWSMAIGMMDKTGKYGVLEFANDKIIWNEGRPGFACGQGNFYWNKEKGTTRFGQGHGRWRKLMEYYYDIETIEDMEKAIQKIWYTGLFTDGRIARDWKVDWLSEMNDKLTYFVSNKWLAEIYSWRDNYGIEIDQKHLDKVLEIESREKENGGECWSIDFLKAPENFYDVITVVDLYIKCFRQLPIDAQKMSGVMECSTISYVASNKKLEYVNRFFEMEDVYHIGLDKTVVDYHPSDKKHGSQK